MTLETNTSTNEDGDDQRNINTNTISNIINDDVSNDVTDNEILQRITEPILHDPQRGVHQIFPASSMPPSIPTSPSSIPTIEPSTSSPPATISSTNDKITPLATSSTAPPAIATTATATGGGTSSRTVRSATRNRDATANKTISGGTIANYLRHPNSFGAVSTSMDTGIVPNSNTRGSVFVLFGVPDDNNSGAGSSGVGGSSTGSDTSLHQPLSQPQLQQTRTRAASAGATRYATIGSSTTKRQQVIPTGGTLRIRDQIPHGNSIKPETQSIKQPQAAPFERRATVAAVIAEMVRSVAIASDVKAATISTTKAVRSVAALQITLDRTQASISRTARVAHDIELRSRAVRDALGVVAEMRALFDADGL